MNQPETVHIGLLISVVTGRMVDPEGLQHVQAWLHRAVGDDGKIARNLAAFELIKQFPWLSRVKVKKVTEKNWRSWLEKQAKEHGLYHVVQPFSLTG